jgi:hypothetical protein
MTSLTLRVASARRWLDSTTRSGEPTQAANQSGDKSPHSKIPTTAVSRSRLALRHFRYVIPAVLSRDS